MSIEIRFTGQECECDWGTFDNSEANPRYRLSSLMLITRDYVRELIADGPRPGPYGGCHSITTEGQRTFAHLDFAGKRTTWELFDAHFDDGMGPNDLMVGRWPD